MEQPQVYTARCLENGMIIMVAPMLVIAKYFDMHQRAVDRVLRELESEDHSEVYGNGKHVNFSVQKGCTLC